MNKFQIIKGNLILLNPLSHLRPLIAPLRGAPQVDGPGLLVISQGLEGGVQRFEYFILTLRHIAEIFHQLRKDVFIGQDAAFGNLDLMWEAQDSLVHFLDAGEDSEDLEGKPPPRWLFVVPFKHVDVFLAQALPLFHRLFDPAQLRHLFLQKRQKS